MNEALRHTGRTTRIVEKACKAAFAGRAVYLLVLNGDHAKRVEATVQRTWEAMLPGISQKRGHGIKVESMMHWEAHQQWDWAEMQPTYQGAHPNCLFLVDHFAVEQKLAEVHQRIKHLAELAGKLYPHTV